MALQLDSQRGQSLHDRQYHNRYHCTWILATQDFII